MKKPWAVAVSMQVTPYSSLMQAVVPDGCVREPYGRVGSPPWRMLSELQTGKAPFWRSSTRPMSLGPWAAHTVGRGGAILPWATSQAAAVESVLRWHTMLPVGLTKRVVTARSGLARSIRDLASAKEWGAPRCGPAAIAVGRSADVARAVGTAPGLAPAESDPADPEGSTVTVTVRRGDGRSVEPHEASRTTTPRAEASERARDGIRPECRDNETMAQQSATGAGRPGPGGSGRAAAVTYPEEVFRRLLTPRWVGMLAGLVVVVAACVLLGLWQLGVARDSGRKEVVAAASSLQRAPLQQVTGPHSAFKGEFSNRAVTVTGTYAAGRSLLVIDRRLGGRAGSWVVTPLETQGGTVPVLRGFVDGTPATVPDPPAGVVTVTGTLGPGESPQPGEPLPAPQVRSIDLATLVNQWPGDLYNVVVLASAESAGPTAGTPLSAAGLTRVPPPELDAPLNLRNAAYAVQWWVFGIFAIWMWWKMFRAEQEAGRPVAAPREGVPT